MKGLPARDEDRTPHISTCGQVSSWDSRMHWAFILTLLGLTLANAWLVFVESWTAFQALVTVVAFACGTAVALIVAVLAIAPRQHRAVSCRSCATPSSGISRTWLAGYASMGTEKANKHSIACHTNMPTLFRQ